MTMRREEDDQLSLKIKTAEWTRAKTYEHKCPHSYVLQRNFPELFDLVQERITRFGVEEEFRMFQSGTLNRYFYWEGFKYWIMGDVLNREDVEEGKAFRKAHPEIYPHLIGEEE